MGFDVKVKAVQCEVSFRGSAPTAPDNRLVSIEAGRIFKTMPDKLETLFQATLAPVAARLGLAVTR